MNGNKTVIVQPYFAHSGHYAQAVLNIAAVLKTVPGISYLLLYGRRDQVFDDIARKVGDYAIINRAFFPGKWPRLKTVYAVLMALWVVRRMQKSTCVVFLDSYFLAAAMVLSAFPSSWLPRKVIVYYLGGPEKLCRNRVMAGFVRHFIGLKPVTIALRTHELEQAWADRLRGLPEGKFTVLPNTENFDTETPLPHRRPRPGRKLKLGVLGQIRKGKSLEWLVPHFANDPSLDELHVAGSFANARTRREYSFLREYPRFTEGFLEGDRLHQIAREMDYLVLLYDKWDARMEAGLLFVAAKVETPVIVFDAGWLGRMNKEYRLGIAAPRSSSGKPEFLKALPATGSAEYLRMIEGLQRFRESHSDAKFRDTFLRVCEHSETEKASHED